MIRSLRLYSRHGSGIKDPLGVTYYVWNWPLQLRELLSRDAHLLLEQQH